MTDTYDRDKWYREARRWAEHAYCYPGMIDEFPEHFAQYCEAEDNPYEAVDIFAEDAGLDRADGFYGINSGVTFTKEKF